MAENPETAPASQEPLPPQAFDESEAVARDLTVPEVFVLVTALLLLVALGRAVEQILSPFVLIGALLFILYPLRHNRLVSRLTVLGSVFFALWFFYSILGRLTPFIVAFLLAYLLNPVVSFLERKGVPRWSSSLAAILLMVGGVLLLLLFAMPVVIQQFNDILAAIGHMVQDFADLLRSGKIFDFLAGYGLPVEKARDVISRDISPRLETLLTALFGGVFGFLTGVSDVVLQLVNAVIVPVLLFYILMDYPHIMDRLVQLVPVHRREAALAFGRRVDNLMGRYFRGAITVAIIQGTISSIGLWLIGVRYPVALGIITGLLTLVPFFGIIVSLVVSTIVAALSPTPVLWRVLAVIAMFLSQNLLETTVLSPKIVGRQVGLHPVALLLALLVFGFFLGFIGLLIAVPTTSLLLTIWKDWEASRPSRLVPPA